MEVKRTVTVKLDVPEGRRDDLHQTIQEFNIAANYTIGHGRDEDGDVILNKTSSSTKR